MGSLAVNTDNKFQELELGGERPPQHVAHCPGVDEQAFFPRVSRGGENKKTLASYNISSQSI